MYSPFNYIQVYICSFNPTIYAQIELYMYALLNDKVLNYTFLYTYNIHTLTTLTSLSLLYLCCSERYIPTRAGARSRRSVNMAATDMVKPWLPHLITPTHRTVWDKRFCFLFFGCQVTYTASHKIGMGTNLMSTVHLPPSPFCTLHLLIPTQFLAITWFFPVVINIQSTRDH